MSRIRRKMTKSDISIGIWNIQGITSSHFGNKLEICDVAFNLEKFDIIGLVETHGNDQCPISMKGYKSIS